MFLQVTRGDLKSCQDNKKGVHTIEPFASYINQRRHQLQSLAAEQTDPDDVLGALRNLFVQNQKELAKKVREDVKIKNKAQYLQRKLLTEAYEKVIYILVRFVSLNQLNSN